MCVDFNCNIRWCRYTVRLHIVFLNHFGCCKGIVLIINHYNESPINIRLKNNVVQFGIASIFRAFFIREFPRNYQLAKIHFRVIALVKAFKFNLSSVIFRNSAFSNSIISAHKDLREILPHRKHRVTSQLSLASSSLVIYPLLTLSKPIIKRVLTMKVNRVPAWRSIDNSKNYFWPKLLTIFEPRYFLYKFLKMGCVLSMHQICDPGQKNRPLSRPYVFFLKLHPNSRILQIRKFRFPIFYLFWIWDLELFN